MPDKVEAGGEATLVESCLGRSIIGGDAFDMVNAGVRST